MAILFLFSTEAEAAMNEMNFHNTRENNPNQTYSPVISSYAFTFESGYAVDIITDNLWHQIRFGNKAKNTLYEMNLFMTSEVNQLTKITYYHLDEQGNFNESEWLSTMSHPHATIEPVSSVRHRTEKGKVCRYEHKQKGAVYHYESLSNDNEFLNEDNFKKDDFIPFDCDLEKGDHLDDFHLPIRPERVLNVLRHELSNFANNATILKKIVTGIDTIVPVGSRQKPSTPQLG